MSDTQTKIISVFAPVKINLYLHITGRLDNGYHTLDSLVGFADIGDQIIIEPANDFEFHVEGPYAQSFDAKTLDASPHSSNLVVQAAWALSHAAQKIPNIRATLTKNIPLASGLGGGSSDAAAIIWGLLEWWEMPPAAPYLSGLMSKLGADVPVCLNCTPARMRGIGDLLDPAPMMDETPIVLVNPGVPCPTADIFMRYNSAFKNPQTLPEDLRDFNRLITFLHEQDNDLEAPACEVVPEVSNVLSAFKTQDGCALARLSGSGASCFGLFRTELESRKAAQEIKKENPDWWVKTGWLNRPERY
jgi:4-diphosphocytidyl-2-C-methyl-D-erythritol kinase